MRESISQMQNRLGITPPPTFQDWQKQKDLVQPNLKTKKISISRTINWENRSAYKNIEWGKVLIKLRTVYKFKFIADLLEIDEATVKNMILGFKKTKNK